jgi:hypothetical protein
MQNALDYSASSPSAVTLTSFTMPHLSEQASSTNHNTTEGCTPQPTTAPIPHRFDFTLAFSGTLTPNHHLWGHFENAVRLTEVTVSEQILAALRHLYQPHATNAYNANKADIWYKWYNRLDLMNKELNLRTDK